MNTKIESISSPKRLARIAGLFYLLVGIFGGFAEGLGIPRCTWPATRRPRPGMCWRTPDLSA